MSTILLPKTQHLVVFQEVIRSGSIGSAAKELGLTQPAVSKIINDIEDYFGVELVVRKNTGVTLTPAGQLLLSRSESITREMKNMVNEISGMSSEAVVEVSFGFPSLIGFTFMSGMINKFKEVFPKAQVSMYEAQLSSFLPAIRDGRLDFAIGTLSAEMKLQDLHVEPLFLLLLMAFVIWFGKDLMVKVMSYLVWPFIASLVLISLSLIPYWNSAVIDQVDLGSLSLTGHDGILITVWLGISIMVFSFNFSPIVSSFVVSKREEYEKDFGRDFTERKCSQIISRASMLMVAVVMFFAFSCLFTLSPANMAEAKAQNIPVLSYLANHFASMTGTKTTFAITLEYAASIIALVAIFKSFFGHYLGTLEGLNGLVLKFGYKGDKTKVSLGKLNTISMIFIMGSTWVVAYANPNILDLIEAMGAPIIASLLCLLPMYAIRKAPSLAKYRGRLDNVFVTVIGLLTILNIVYKLF